MNKIKTILITGASLGLGKQLANDYLSQGHRVINVDITESNISHENFHSQIFDLNQNHEVLIGFLEELSSEYDIDLVILNAGTTGIFNLSIPNLEMISNIINTNYLSNVAFCCFFADYFRRKNNGHIVCISTIGHSRGIPGVSAYFSSKSALGVMMESLRGELPSTIKTTIINPGFISTKMATGEKIKHSFVSSVEVASLKIRKAIELEKTSYSFPFAMRFLTFVNRNLPDFIYDRVIKKTTK